MAQLSSFFCVKNHRLAPSGMKGGACWWYAICNATLVWDLQAAEFGMVFAGDILDVMSNGEEQRRFEACEHKHTTSRFIHHLAKAELAVPFFCTDIHILYTRYIKKRLFFRTQHEMASQSPFFHPFTEFFSCVA